MAMTASKAEDDDDAEPLIVMGYQRPQHRRPGTALKAVDPHSGQIVAVDKVSEHMRVKTLDPRWKEQQKREQEKWSTTNLAPDADMSRVLSKFAARRSDIFGDEEGRLGQNVSELSKPKRSPLTSARAASGASSLSMFGGRRIETQNTQLRRISSAPRPPHLDGDQSTTRTPHHFQHMVFATDARGPPFFSPETSIMPPGPPPRMPPSFMAGGWLWPLPQFAAADSDQPAAKRSRTDLYDATAAAFAPQGPVTLSVALPALDASEYRLQGQSINVTVLASGTVKDVKEAIQRIAGVPVGKCQLKDAVTRAFLKDTQLLQPEFRLELVMRERGGKKKA